MPTAAKVSEEPIFGKNIDNAIVRAGLPPISTNNYQVRGGLTFLFH
ncbi:MAG: hypothetical protein HY282_11940 [Nitrospirae bacterium]|nr:hypothetical protein [Candidatus Manganitrophaceae bacterium]